MSVPTPKQMSKLAALPVGTAVINPRRNDWRPLLSRGWVEPLSQIDQSNLGYAYDGMNAYLSPLRIAPDGLRALADAIDAHGQPEMVEPQTLLRDGTRPCGVEAMASYERGPNADAAVRRHVRTLVIGVNSTNALALEARADATTSLRALGFTQEQVVEIRTQALDRRPVGEILDRLLGVGEAAT